MAKTANTVNVGDMIYHPIVDEIEEIPITSIVKSEKGIEIGANKWGIRLKESEYNAAISTELKFIDSDHHRYFLNLEDAKNHQRKLQEKRLKYLQEKAHEALQHLNKFTLKYFTNEKTD